MTNEESAAEDAALRLEYRALAAEHTALLGLPADSEACRAHGVKLRAHIERLHARIAALRERLK
jgi:hypothetical protein